MNKKFIGLLLLIYIISYSTTLSAAPIGWRFSTYQQAKIAVENTENINITDKQGKTPLIWAAAYNDDCRVIELLLAAGAEPNLADEQGKTALIHAVENENSPCVIKKLLAAGAEVNEQSARGNTALIWAVKNNNRDLAKILVTAQADIYLANNNDQTALQISKEKDRVKLQNILLQANKPKNEQNNSRTDSNNPQDKINTTEPREKKTEPNSPQSNRPSKELTNNYSLYSGVNYNSYQLNNENLSFQSDVREIGAFIGATSHLNKNTALGLEFEYLNNIFNQANFSTSITNLYAMLHYHFLFLGAGTNYVSLPNQESTGLSLKTGVKIKTELGDNLNFNSSFIYRRLRNKIISTEIDLSSYGLQGELEVEF